MKTIPTKTTYLQMFSPCMPHAAVAPPGVETTHLFTPAVEQYLRLYNTVGANYRWVDRNRMPAGDLSLILNDDRVEVHEIRVQGRSAGYAELDGRVAGEIELAYFGLFPEYVGQGLGKFLLLRALEIAWAKRPRRVWVHTCDLDHPAALNNYLRAGFTIYDERIIQQPVPDSTP